MAWTWPQRRRWGAIVGLVALYAVLLQGLLVATAPVERLAPLGVLCAAHDPDAPPDGPPGRADHADHACCTLAHAAGLAAPSAIDVAGPRPAVRATIVPRRPEADVPRTGPPTDPHGPRGPPPA